MGIQIHVSPEYSDKVLYRYWICNGMVYANICLISVDSM